MIYKIIFIILILIFVFSFSAVFALNPLPREITRDQIREYYPDAPDIITIEQLDEFNKMSPVKITQEQLNDYNSGGSIKLTDEQRDAAWDAIKSSQSGGDEHGDAAQLGGTNKTVSSKFNFKYPWEGTKTLGGSEGLVSKFYTYALAAAGVAAFGVIIYGGILWTMSGAVSSRAEAKEWITAAVSGLALLLFAVLILRLINPAILELKDPSVPPIQDSKEK